MADDRNRLAQLLMLGQRPQRGGPSTPWLPPFEQPGGSLPVADYVGRQRSPDTLPPFQLASGGVKPIESYGGGVPAYMQPFAGLHNEPYFAPGPAPAEPPQQQPLAGEMPPQAAGMPAAADVPFPKLEDGALNPDFVMPPPAMPDSVPVGMNPAQPDVLAALAEIKKRQMLPAQWAVNEGNLADQIAARNG